MPIPSQPVAEAPSCCQPVPDVFLCGNCGGNSEPAGRLRPHPVPVSCNCKARVRDLEETYQKSRARLGLDPWAFLSWETAALSSAFSFQQIPAKSQSLLYPCMPLFTRDTCRFHCPLGRPGASFPKISGCTAGTPEVTHEAASQLIRPLVHQ